MWPCRCPPRRIVVSYHSATALLHRQARLGAIQSLNLALLIGAQDEARSDGFKYNPTISSSFR